MNPQALLTRLPSLGAHAFGLPKYSVGPAAASSIRDKAGIRLPMEGSRDQPSNRTLSAHCRPHNHGRLFAFVVHRLAAHCLNKSCFAVVVEEQVFVGGWKVLRAYALPRAWVVALTQPRQSRIHYCCVAALALFPGHG